VTFGTSHTQNMVTIFAVRKVASALSTRRSAMVSALVMSAYRVSERIPFRAVIRYQFVNHGKLVGSHENPSLWNLHTTVHGTSNSRFPFRRLPFKVASTCRTAPSPTPGRQPLVFLYTHPLISELLKRFCIDARGGGPLRSRFLKAC
jgi:hypothetical protein